MDIFQVLLHWLDVGPLVLSGMEKYDDVSSEGPTCRFHPVLCRWHFVNSCCRPASELPQVSTVPSARMAAKAPDEASICCTSRSFSFALGPTAQAERSVACLISRLGMEVLREVVIVRGGHEKIARSGSYS